MFKKKWMGNSSKKKIIMAVFSIALCVLIIIFLYMEKRYADSFKEVVIPQAVCSESGSIYCIGYHNGENANSIYRFNIDKKIFELFCLECHDEIQRWDRILCVGQRLYAAGRRKDGTYIIEAFGKDGESLGKLDISSSINDFAQDSIRNFLMDGEGNFYIRTYLKNEIIILNSQGEKISCLKDFSDNAIFESMAACDKCVYALFSNNTDSGGGYTIMAYYAEDAEEIYRGDLLPYMDIYSVMGTGTKYDLLFKGDMAVYGYRIGEQKAELLTILSLQEYDFTRSCFSADDKLYCFVIQMSRQKPEMVKKVDIQTIELN